MAIVSSSPQTTGPVRGLLIGNSGAGKTSSLLSLLRAGYTIRMLDMDNNSSALVNLCRHEDPSLLERLDVISLRDKFRASQLSGLEVAGQPKAFVDMLRYMNKWDDGTVPAEWPCNTIFVLDTLTSVGRAAFHWAKGMNPTSKDPRQWYGAAQEAIKTLLEMITSPDFSPHVLVLSHVELIELPDGTIQGFVSSLGKALGPFVPKVFPMLLLAERKGTGDKVRRVLTTVPTAMLDLKNPAPFTIPPSLPLSEGLATIFTELTGAPKAPSV